ncbi:MAG: YraN family protein [Armatimonadaceae bacterium]
MPGELKATGQRGEDVAARYLEGSGAEILARNVRPGNGIGIRGELDILCVDAHTLCVVEVKTLRRRGGEMSPGMNVTPAKQRQIVMLTHLWLAENQPQNDIGIRFDVIEVTLGTSGTPVVTWHKGAFLAS